ncbi:MAG: hypothetical protein DVB23_001863 [Verrucomicrobia bacterium]|jgi:hypothetical protein|nr:MAG: hypothetical protein DVB23_001863 [Verrucomicrobiota bacterium]
MNPDQRPQIGWREWLALPDLGVPAIKAKIDTGARSSALHTHDYQIVERGGLPFVVFRLHPFTDDPSIEVIREEPVTEFRVVRDSGGHAERRPFIRTRVLLGTHEWNIDLNLTNRERMTFRMLLGREAMNRRFRVVPDGSYLLSPQQIGVAR